MSDFAKNNTEELQHTLAEKREALRTFRFGGAGSRTRNVREGRTLRREIAQILTEVNARSAKERKAVLASKVKTA